MQGAELPVAIDKHDTCAACSGSGAEPGTSPRLCPECKGPAGVRGRDARRLLDVRALPALAPATARSIQIDSLPHLRRVGGSVAGRETYRVRIPPGAKDGTKVRLRGKGQAWRCAAARPATCWSSRASPRAGCSNREGDDLTIQVPVTFAEAALGAHVEAPTHPTAA